jgi:hypothetical protein
MRTKTNTNNRRRVEPRVEPLEGKTLLSAGGAMHHAAHEAAVVAQAPGPITGSLTGHYSNIHIPFAGHLLNYNTNGTLTPVGSSHVYGSWYVRGATPNAGRFVGRLFVRNDGGSMTLRIYQTAVGGTDTYTVGHASGNDSDYQGDTGTLTITQNPTYSYPYYTAGTATTTFS